MSKVFKKPEQVIYVCCGSKCKKKGGKELSKEFKHLIKQGGLKGEVQVIKTDCTDNCKRAPVISFQPGNKWFSQVKPADAKSLFEENIDMKEKSL